MPRVKIDLPEKHLFVAEIPVRITDINYGGHLGNDALLSLLHEARVQFLKRFGFTEADVGGVGTMMTDAAIVYEAEIRYGETLRVEVGVAEVHAAGADITYRVLSGDREVARARTGIVFFDYAARRIARTPASFREAIAAAP
jgi:acyl-CoA thioester hydrolase